MSAMMLYFIILLDSLIGLSLGLMFISVGSIVPIIAIWVTDMEAIPYNDEDIKLKKAKLRKIAVKRIKIAVTAALFFMMSAVFIPSTKQAVIMYVIPKITKSKEFTKIPPLIIKYIEKQVSDKGDK